MVPTTRTTSMRMATVSVVGAAGDIRAGDHQPETHYTTAIAVIGGDPPLEVTTMTEHARVHADKTANVCHPNLILGSEDLTVDPPRQ
mmetsp:Transcript_3359/g.5703  ORF Transcript_3359/g.5703 Transcript_3359/m.5703 type:complete len:87 (-) Transcript_3359:1560-1820(-)